MASRRRLRAGTGTRWTAAYGGGAGASTMTERRDRSARRMLPGSALEYYYAGPGWGRDPRPIIHVYRNGERTRGFTRRGTPMACSPMSAGSVGRDRCCAGQVGGARVAGARERSEGSRVGSGRGCRASDGREWRRSRAVPSCRWRGEDECKRYGLRRGKRAQPPRPWRGRWQGMARAGLVVLAYAFASTGQAQIQARDLDDAVSRLVRTLVNEGQLARQAVYVGKDDFFEEENELRPPLSGILRTGCLQALTDRQVRVVLVPGDAARVLHGRWRRESETHLHLTLFIAEPPQAREEPVALVSAYARVPVEGLRPSDIEPTLRHWGERVVRRLERDLPGSGRFGVHLSPFPAREGLSENFGRYLHSRWRPAFTASDRFMLVGDSSSAEGVVHGEVFVAGGRVEVGVHIEDGQGNSVAADHVALEQSLFPSGIVTGGIVDLLLEKCASYERRDRLTEPRGANAVECYREVLEETPGNPTAQAGLDSIREQYAGEVQGLIDQGKFDAARAKAAQLVGVLSSEDPWTWKSEEWIETAQARHFIERAEEAIGRGEFDKARAEVGRLAELNPEHLRVSELRGRIRTAQTRHFIERVETAIGRGEFDKARTEVGRLAELSPEHPRVSELEGRIRTAQTRHFIKRAEEAIGRGAFEEARAEVGRLAELSPEHPRVSELEERIRTAQARHFIERVEEAIGRGEFDKARVEVGRLAELNPEHPRLSELREKIEKEEKIPGHRFRDCDGSWCPELVVVPTGEYRMARRSGRRDGRMMRARCKM